MRQILKDSVAKERFISSDGSIESALRTLGPAPSKKAHGLLGDIEQISESLQRYPWTTLAALKVTSRFCESWKRRRNSLKSSRRRCLGK